MRPCKCGNVKYPCEDTWYVSEERKLPQLGVWKRSIRRVWLQWIHEGDKGRPNGLAWVPWEGEKHHHDTSRVQGATCVPLDTRKDNTWHNKVLLFLVDARDRVNIRLLLGIKMGSSWIWLRYKGCVVTSINDNTSMIGNRQVVKGPTERESYHTKGIKMKERREWAKGNPMPTMNMVEGPICRIRVNNGRIHTVPLDNPSLGYFFK